MIEGSSLLLERPLGSGLLLIHQRGILSKDRGTKFLSEQKENGGTRILIKMSQTSFLSIGSMSKVLESSGNKDRNRSTCFAIIVIFPTSALAKIGLMAVLDLFQWAPSAMKIPLPKIGALILDLVGGFPNSSNPTVWTY